MMKGELESMIELVRMEEDKVKWHKAQESRKDTLVNY